MAARSKSDTARRPIEMILANGQVFPHPGKFRAIDARTDATTGTVSIDIAFPNPTGSCAPDSSLLHSLGEPNAQGRARDPQPRIAGPAGDDACGADRRRRPIHMKVVKTGPVSGPMTVIAEGLAAGDRVVVEGLQRVRDGVVVRAKAAPPPSDSTAAPAATDAPPAAPAAAPADSTKKPATP